MNLATFLADRAPVLFDGAMGTQLERAGLNPGGWNNVTNPEQVPRIHQEYAGCGCHILITNTLTMNRIYIETHDVDVDVHEVNLAGARLARQGATPEQYVLGNMSSTGSLLAPYGDLAEADACKAFREQAAVLAEGGVDGFIIETMFDLNEARCAVRACRDVASLPVIACMAFTTAENDGRTMMGNSAAECAVALTEEGADVIGANCGDLSPEQTAIVVALLCDATSRPVLAQPNAGMPKLVGNRTVFDMTPEAFAAGISACMDAGARLAGGCCGTTPGHIRAVADVLGIEIF